MAAGILRAVIVAGVACLAGASSAATPAEEAAKRQIELDALTRDIAVTAERQAELRREIEAIDKDRASLNQSLIDAGKSAQALEKAVDDTETRARALAANEAAIRASLLSRRDVLAEVLAALQRMGRRPPPAVLVRPEDALASIRSAVLLGAVVPDLRAEADRLAVDLRALVTLRGEIARERDRLIIDATALAENRARIRLLIEEKRNQLAASTTALTEEEAKAATLADQATSLKELIGRMEKEIAAASAAKAAAEQAAADNRNVTSARGKPTSLGAADRLAPAVAFADAKGLLPLPVNGTRTVEYGAMNLVGGRAEGLSIATRPNAQVSSPTDGWVVYAGPFRSYGQLLIINAGDGYHVLLAGMERIDVQLGQFVLAGEPVAMMASTRLASAGSSALVSSQPVLYIEFRKDGVSIDPAPWWATAPDKKVGG